MSSKFVPRVNQLDAIQLDSEVGRIIEEQLNSCYSALPPGIFSKYQPEINLILRSAVWFSSVFKFNSSFGQQLLSLQYDQLSKNKLVLHYVFQIVSKYAKDITDVRFTTNTSLQKTMSWIDLSSRVLYLLNFFRFLKTGQKPTLVDYILNLSYISEHGNKSRNVGYAYMTRELIWGGFMELLAVSIPLINFHSVKRKLRNTFRHKLTAEKSLMNRGPALIPFDTSTKCSFCNERPSLPHTMGCSHVFCYYCLAGNQRADPQFQCNICDFSNGSITPLLIRI